MPWGEGYMEKTGRKARNRTKSQEVTQNGVQGSASECPSRTVCECHCWPILVWVSRRSGGRKERPIWGALVQVQLPGNIGRSIHYGFITSGVKSLSSFISKCMQFRFSRPLHSASSTVSKLQFWVGFTRSITFLDSPI
ncbi:hypothetical protein CK203_026726 [Vitis vinifera]|uniref:Uncharacterized protein n=1 Tax=Vitis vinifera TaxID=29760 RepID=A0A438IU17_VITVI|nr:hypothetical protein CK203_026726 [Vitis vinifera]